MISSVSPSSPLLVYSLPNKCVRTEESAFNDRLFWSQLSNKVIRQCHDATGVLHLVGFSPQSLTIHTATAFSSIYHPKKKKMERLPHAGWMMGFWKGKPSRDSSVTCSFPVPRRMFSFLFHCIPHFFFSPPSISPCLEAPCLCTFWIWNLSATEAYQQAAYLLLFSLFLLFDLLFSLCWSSFFFLGKIKLQFYFSTSKCTHIINKRLCHSLLGLRKGDCYSQKKTFRKNCFRLYGLTNLLEKNFFWCQM